MNNYRLVYVITYDVVASDIHEARKIAQEYIYNDEHGYPDEAHEFVDGDELPRNWWPRNVDNYEYEIGDDD